MSVTFDPEVAQRRFAESSDEELVRIAYVDGDSYVPEALVLAKEELRLRGIDGASHPAAVAARRVVEATKLEAKAKSELPANGIILLLSFVFADLIAIVAAILYSTNGRARAATAVWKAFALGWLARIVLVGWVTYPWGE